MTNVFASQRGFIKFLYDPDSGSRLQFNQSSLGESGKYSRPVCQYGLLGVAMACQFTTCRGSFPSCREENDFNPKSGRDLNPNKPV